MGSSCSVHKPAEETPIKVWGDAAKNFRAGGALEATEDNLATSLKKIESTLVTLDVEKAKPTRSVPALPSPEIMSAVSAWDFADLHSIPYDALPALAFASLMSHPEISVSNARIDRVRLWRYISEVAARYHARPFHNFRHAVDVLLASSSLMRMVRQDHADVCSDPTLVGALLIGALVHDIDHPGLMNPYLIATKNAIAAEDYDAAARVAKYAISDSVPASPNGILERHHIAVALTLLDKPELDFLSGHPERGRFVGLMREVVLATDVTTSGAAIKEFTAAVDAGSSGDHGDAGPSAYQVMRIIIKAADISNPARPLPVYEQWIAGVMSEFFRQGDSEKLLGLQMSMNCDRATVVVGKCQVGFISFLVGPLYRSLAAYSPSVQRCVDALDKNLEHYKQATV